MLPILQVGDVLLSPDIFTEHFCCDLSACGGACCVEGEAGAPVTAEECRELERVLPAVRMQLDPRARKILDKQGVAYRDSDGDLVTSIVGGRECCFARYDEDGLRDPLIRRFGAEWYAELEALVELLRHDGLLEE